MKVNDTRRNCSMRISCTLEDLLKALKHIIAVVPKVPIPESLAYVKIVASSDGLVLLNVADLRVGVSLSLSALVVEAGVSCTPARDLLNCLSYYAGMEATVTLVDDAFHFQFIIDQQEPIRLVRGRAEDCPQFPLADKAEFVGAFSPQDFRDALSQVLPAAAYEYNYAVAQALSCIWMQCEESGAFTFAACDKYCIAMRRIQMHSRLSLSPFVVLASASDVFHLLPAFPNDGNLAVSFLSDRGYLLFQTEHFQAMLRLHTEYGRGIHAHEQLEYLTIPFLSHIPKEQRTLLVIPTKSFRKVVKKQEMQHCSLQKIDGRWHLSVTRYSKGRLVGEKTLIPVYMWGEPFQDLWLQNWNLADVLCSSLESSAFVLSLSEDSHARITLRWLVDGAVEQKYAYLFLAEDPYLARLKTKIDNALSPSAQRTLETLLRTVREVREPWLVTHVREAVLARIFFLAEQVGVPTAIDVQRIVDDPRAFGERFENQSRMAGNRKDRDQRFDHLVTQAAVQAFSTDGVTITFPLSGRILLRAESILALLAQARTEESKSIEEAR